MTEPILTPFLDASGVTLYAGDCIEVMRQLPEASVDAIVTDPPYGLEFMGKDWDAFAPTDRKNAAVWNGRRQGQAGWEQSARERSGKGGGGPSYRSQHKGSKRCQRCGRRQFSGTPCECVDPDWVIEHRREAPSTMLGFQSFSEAWAREAYRILKPGGHLLAFAGTRTYHRMASGVEDAGFEIRDCIAWMYGSGFPKSLDVSKAIAKAAGAQREVIDVIRSPYKVDKAEADRRAYGKFDHETDERGYLLNSITAPATSEAQKWSGWGTALKPAFEPVVVARKPLIGTVAQNVLEHGTGAINIDACRIGTSERLQGSTVRNDIRGGAFGAGHRPADDIESYAQNANGRWPANVVLDEAAGAMLDAQTGITRSNQSMRGERAGSVYGGGNGPTGPDTLRGHADIGGASRFFYCAKASKKDRNTNGAQNTHPTVKPTELMRWLIRLVTPPGGIILDPFGGSGSTGVAARAEGVRCILIEREAEYLDIIRQRLDEGPLLSMID